MSVEDQVEFMIEHLQKEVEEDARNKELLNVTEEQENIEWFLKSPDYAQLD